MWALLSRTATLLIVAVTGIGCGGEGGSGPGSSVLTALELTPPTATLFTIAPGNTVTLTVVAKDQDGQPMAGLGSPSFSSDNGSVAQVGEDGTVTAVGPGTARIAASLTAGGVTHTATTRVTVQVAPANVGVVAPEFVFQPAKVDVSAGGSVSWIFGAIHHDVTFTTPGAPDNIPVLENGSASRVFPSHGAFTYRCSIHPSMTGVVQVH